MAALQLILSGASRAEGMSVTASLVGLDLAQSLGRFSLAVLGYVLPQPYNPNPNLGKAPNLCQPIMRRILKLGTVFGLRV